MEKFSCFLKDDKIIIQEADYIEDGCYIEIIGKDISLYEIPYGGGEVMCIGKFESLIEAIDYSKTLS